MKSTNLEIFTFDSFLKENLPPLFNSKGVPKWYEKLNFFCGETKLSDNLPPKKHATIKGCPAIKDFLQSGIEIPLWSDIDFYIDTKEKSVEWNYANIYENFKTVSSHPFDQYHTLSNKYINIKVVSPWIFKCNRDIDWLLTRPTYRSSVFDDNGIVFCDGIVNFRHNFVTNVNLFFPLNRESYTVSFSAGEIFQKFIPLTENNINIEVKTCTVEEYNSMAMINRSLSFRDGSFYKLLTKHRRNYE